MGTLKGMLAAAFVLCVGYAGPAAAAELHGRVVKVTDGDTVVVLDAAREQHKVRLQGIDAPERKQAFSEKSKLHLSDLVFGKDVVVRWDKRDRYGRIVGKVLVADRSCGKPPCPKDVDAGLEQIEAGLAWWYRAYAKEQTPDDRAAHEREEKKARARGVGVWSEKNPTAPWDFRKAKRSGAKR
jgi:endonuclease YncB( thermonuclease family)